MFQVIDTTTNEAVFTNIAFAEALRLRDAGNAGAESSKYPRYVVGRA